jgi:hypothetical protein
MSGFDSLIALADEISVLETVKGKLLEQPNPAADKLAVVLVEISKVLGALNSELSRYLSVTFYDEQTFKDRAQERAHLVELESGEITVRMSRARGHCKKILSIFDEYLMRWFDDVLSDHESLPKIHALFMALAGSDTHMVDAIDETSIWLSEEAESIVDLVDTGRFQEANERIKAERKEILPRQKRIVNAMRTLLDRQEELSSISA